MRRRFVSEVRTLRFDRHRIRGRRAVSDVVAAVMAIAITLVAGAAAWGYTQNQAGASERAIQDSNLVANNFLSEHFDVVDMYFGSSTTVTFWVYNTGSVTFQPFSVRLVGSGGNINVLFNHTTSGGTQTEQVYDLRSSSASKCKTAATSLESPLLTATHVKTTNAQLFTLTLPASQGGCPSYGNQFQSGHTYTVVVTGLYGNVVTYSQTM